MTFIKISMMCLVASILCCGSNKSTPAIGTVSGNVYDESNNPISGASVVVYGKTLTTDSSGAFSTTLVLKNITDNSVALAVNAAGYANQYRFATIDARTHYLVFNLRKLDINQTIDLSTDQHMSITRDAITTRLSIPAGSLVLPSGKQATGSATLTATYWSPTEGATSLPGPLLNSDLTTLQSYGMWQVEVMQNNLPLQPASGQTIAFNIDFSNAPEWVASIISQQPAVYTLDETTSLWNNDTSTITTAGNTVTVAMQHFSYWNIDSQAPTPPSVCFYGKVYNKCGLAPHNANNVSLYLYASNNVLQFNTQTDKNGAYCVQTNLIRTHNLPTNDTTQSLYIPYYLENPNTTTYYTYDSYIGTSLITSTPTLFIDPNLTAVRCDPLFGHHELVTVIPPHAVAGTLVPSNDLRYGYDFGVSPTNNPFQGFECCINYEVSDNTTTNGDVSTNFLTCTTNTADNSAMIAACNATGVGANAPTCQHDPFSASYTAKSNPNDPNISRSNGRSCIETICQTPTVPLLYVSLAQSTSCPVPLTDNNSCIQLDPIIINDGTTCNSFCVPNQSTAGFGCSASNSNPCCTQYAVNTGLVCVDESCVPP